MTPAQRTDAILAAHDRPGAPGVAVAVLRGAETVYARAAGLADLSHRIAIGPHTGFRIGSASKHFSVAVALLLAREGRLDIDQPVRRYLPALRHDGAAPTLRQLMNNTSGVPDFLELLIASGAGVLRPVTWEQSRDLVLRQSRLNCAPGSEFIYSAGGFLVLCMVIEALCGQPMEAVLAERLFAPLGMAETALVRSERPVIAKMASPYIEVAPGTFVKGGWGLEASGEGGIVSTATDMATWLAELARPKVLDADIVAAMATPLTYAHGGKGRYGLGLYVQDSGGRRVFGHGGRMPSFRAEVARYPDADLSLVVLTNLHGVDPCAVGRDIAAAWLPESAARSGSPAPGPRAEAGDALAGRFLAPESGDVIEIRRDGARLVLAASSGPLPLAEIAPGLWEPVSTTWDLRLRAAPGGLDALYCGRPAFYARLGAPPPFAAADYVGDFESPPLGSVYRIRLDAAGRLALRMQGELGYYDTLLEPIAADLFRAAPADPRAAWNQPMLRFLRDPQGAVTALLYNTDRTRNLHFARIA